MSRKKGDLAIRRVFRVHRSLVFTLPRFVRSGIRLFSGDYVVIELKGGGKSFVVTKWGKEKMSHGSSGGRRGGEDSGGRLQPAVGGGGGQA